MNEELLPCPFCGGKAELVQNAGYDCPRYIVICTGCDAQIGVSDDPFIAPEHAIAAWNRRTQPAWEPVADGELVQDVLSTAGEGIVCHRFALPSIGQLTQLEMHWVDEDSEWQDYFVALPSTYWLCRQKE